MIKLKQNNKTSVKTRIKILAKIKINDNQYQIKSYKEKIKAKLI